ncbi:DNA cytosine methyltransferase [Stenotrophomonas maltophilia]|uniref:DNA cytosine methyltransferase n=1 Tax=Stenotrophomonas maltophilia TaxID=40324 RepID=UPI0039C2DEE7
MSALAVATPAPVSRSWVAGDRILARSRVPELVTKTLKVLCSPQPDGTVRRKLRLSSNLLPLLGYQPGARFNAKQLGAGAGIELQFAPDGGNKIHCREYARLRARPLEAQIDLQNQQLLDASIPSYTEAVSWHLTPNGKITIKPLANRAFSIGRSLRQRRAADRLEAFVALASGVDIALMEAEGFRVIAALDWRPNEARDKSDKTETGALNATTNSQHLRFLFNEDVFAANWAQIRGQVGAVPVMHCSPQCDDFSTLKGHQARQASIDNMSSVVDMVVPVLRGIEEMQPAVCVIENVPGFLASQAGQILCLQLRRMGYHVSAEVLDAPDFGGLTSRKRAFIVGSVFPGFTFPPALPRNTTPILQHLAHHLGRLPDISHTSTMQKALETGRARLITAESTFAPTLTKSQPRRAKDSVVVQTSDNRYLFIDGPASKTLMGLESVNTGLVNAEIEAEIIGQSVEGPMHSALMRQVREHILVATDARQMHLI